MRMLVVDDEKIIRRGIINGHDWASEGIDDVLEACNGEDAFEKVMQHSPEIVLTDIRMPKMTGLELSKKIHENAPNVKIIMLSGYDDFEYAQQAVRLGVVEYLLKPAKIENIVSVVSKVKNEIEMENSKKAREIMFENQIKDNFSLIKNKFLNDLINGAIRDQECLEENLRFLKINISFDNYVVCIFSLDDISDAEGWNGIKDKELVRFAVSNILNELAGDTYKSVVFEDYLHQIVIIMNMEQQVEFELAVISFAEKCRQCIEDTLSITVTIGIGRYCSEFSGLQISYNEALSAIKHKLIVGKNRVIHIDDLKYFGNSNYYYPKNIEEELIIATEMGDGNNVIKSLEEFFEIFKKGNIQSMPYIKSCCMGLLFILSRKLMELDISTDEQQPEVRRQWSERLEILETLDEIQNYMISIFEQSVGVILESRHSGNKSIISIAKKYINDNIAGDVSLKTVSNVVHMSPNYFTYLFKNEEGKTFSDYVFNQKGELAQKLLHNIDLKMYEVAEMVGYQDSRYFSQFFKKFTGITPSDFRKNIQG